LSLIGFLGFWLRFWVEFFRGLLLVDSEVFKFIPDGDIIVSYVDEEAEKNNVKNGSF
jgi:hypothetical protein